MHPVIAALTSHAAADPGRMALAGAPPLTYAALHRAVGEAAEGIASRTARPVALWLDNGPQWVVADLALLAAQLPCVPLPRFFSPLQQAHALADAGVEWLLASDAGPALEALQSAGVAVERGPDLTLAGRPVACLRPGITRNAALPDGTVKITYTSGTTGTPKGVCLGGSALAAVASSLAEACGLGPRDSHFSVLPLATLLENVAVYASLVGGARCVAMPMEEIGILGASGVRPDTLLAAMARARATTAIMVPQILKAVVERLEAGAGAPHALRFLAVGGAAVAPSLLERAASVGLPVFEGYGLSECASVLTLNTPGARRPGSAGRPLAHVALSFSPEGEILAGGATLLGYCGGSRMEGAPWPTGDLGHLDAEGFLHITGRRKDCFITSYGRNVSPGWIEAALTAEPAIAQAWVSGESRPWPAAVVQARAGYPDAAVAGAIARVNRGLPDYARVGRWIAAREPFSCSNGELTANGRVRGVRLAEHYRAAIDALYQEESDALLR